MKRVVAFFLTLAISLLLLPSPSVASDETLIVDDDRGDCPDAGFTSIQAAVDTATPGETIVVCNGTYHEQVTVTKNGLTIRAKGEPGDVIVDAHGHDAGFRIQNASNVTVQGFTVMMAHEADILLVNSNGNTIRRNVTSAAGHDGIQLFASSGNLIEHNVVMDNLADNACGINVSGGSQNNVIRHNVLTNNMWGIQIAGATTTGNVIERNSAVGNRGNGIRNVGGASGTLIEGNRVLDNGFAPGPFTGFPAGIRIAAGTGASVVRNRAFGNVSVDLLSQSTAATFERNRCETSSPPGLCMHPSEEEQD